MKKRKLLYISILVVLIAGIIGIMGAKAAIETNLEKLACSDVYDVDLSKVDDGVYTGSYKVFPIAVEVEVTINVHRITAIELKKHENGQGLPAEMIPQKVVEAQTLKVDAATGATYSSKVILKAIEDALTHAN